MTSSKKLEIHVRPTASLNSPNVTAREKTIYHCSNCKNKYYSFHYFCPQCLGIVASDRKRQTALRVMSFPLTRKEELAQLIERLSDKKAADVEQALNSPPRILFDQSEPEILAQWQEVLQAEDVRCEIIAADNTIKPKTRKRAPLFTQDVPLPSFMTREVETAARATALKIGNPAIRMKWVEVVLGSFSLIENAYKRYTNIRVLFPDYLYKIEEQLFEASNEFDPRRGNEQDLLKRIEKLLAQLAQMESEIAIVRDRITEQL